MDPDAPPLLKADTLAGQGELLSSRKAYQQALSAHNESARNYQIAAQATSDTTAAKALLLQRDRQLKLVADIQRKLQEKASSATRQYTVKSAASSVLPRERDNGLSRRSTAAAAAAASPITTHHGNLFSPATPAHRLPAHAGHSTYSPKDRVDASMMADSRYSRRSNSPSSSQISTRPGPSADSGRASSVEESYYLMRSEAADPADPMSTFLALVDNMVNELGNAIAFASVPLHHPPPASGHVADGSSKTHRKTQSGEAKGAKEGSSAARPEPAVSDSFIVIDPRNPGQRDTSTSDDRPVASRRASMSTKTQEELLHENATLKETLDNLSKRLEWLTKERQRDRDALRGSMTLFARDVRKQAERVMAQSTANLMDTRRNVPMPPLSAPLAQNTEARGAQNAEEQVPPALLAAQRKIADLQEEVKAARAEADKQAGNAQRYRTRYEELRKAIVEKRKAKEEAQAAAAALSSAKASSSDKPDSGLTAPG